MRRSTYKNKDLYQAMNEAAIGVHELAKASGLSAPTIARMLNGKRVFAKSIRSVCKTLCKMPEQVGLAKLNEVSLEDVE